jgi:hypothetical protein
MAVDPAKTYHGAVQALWPHAAMAAQQPLRA